MTEAAADPNAAWTQYMGGAGSDTDGESADNSTTGAAVGGGAANKRCVRMCEKYGGGRQGGYGGELLSNCWFVLVGLA